MTGGSKLFTGTGFWQLLRREPQGQLLILSILALFCELLVIRWLSTEVRIFAYFKNLPLMSAFLGLGLGFIWADKKRDLLSASRIALLFLSGLLVTALGAGLTYLTFLDPAEFLLWGVGRDQGANHAAPAWLTVRNFAIMLVIFLLSTTVFVGFGQRMGKLFNQMKPLEAYSINVLGGLLGTILFSILSMFSTSPGMWLVIAGLMLLLVDRRKFAIPVAITVLGLAYSLGLGTYIAQKAYGTDFVKTVWSPYYRIDVVRHRESEGVLKGLTLGYHVYINYDIFQSMIDCSPTLLRQLPKEVQQLFSDAHGRPYKLLSKPGRVLILGSGTGSDVAAALRTKQAHIDAVEIDPGIIELGQEIHPEHPYAAPNVSVFITDARNFLKNSKDKYDLIVFAALDSHAAFSSLSSLRMDNYVFTQEALQEAANCLSPSGIIYMIFVLPDNGDWLWDRHSKALASACKYTPVGFRYRNDIETGILIAGPGVNVAQLPPPFSHMPKAVIDPKAQTPVSTDDWPFLFLPRREVPALYTLPVLAVLTVAFLSIATQFVQGRRSLLNWQMFTLGMGFMLLEVRAMSELSLLCGSTWIVNSIIISGVLVLVLLANWLAVSLNLRSVPFLLSGLLVTLLVGTNINSGDLSHLGQIPGIIVGSLIHLLPLFFAAAVFAVLFKNTTLSNVALAFNLIGGLVGVCLEYFSMWLGVRSLGFIAMAIYAGVLILDALSRKDRNADQQQPTSEPL